VIADLNRNLPSLLESLHISNPVLSAGVTAAVGLILSTVNSFAALIPHTTTAAAVGISSMPQHLPSRQELKERWNEQVCAALEGSQAAEALAECMIH